MISRLESRNEIKMTINKCGYMTMHMSSWASGLCLYVSGTLEEKMKPLNGTCSNLQLKVWHISVIRWDDRNEDRAYFRAT